MWYQLFCGCGATSISDGIISTIAVASFTIITDFTNISCNSSDLHLICFLCQSVSRPMSPDVLFIMIINNSAEFIAVFKRDWISWPHDQINQFPFWNIYWEAGARWYCCIRQRAINQQMIIRYSRIGHAEEPGSHKCVASNVPHSINLVKGAWPQLLMGLCLQPLSMNGSCVEDAAFCWCSS